MNKHLTNEQAALVKKIRMQMIIIALLLIIIVVGLFQFYFTNNKVSPKTYLDDTRFRGAVHDQVAEIGMGNYNSTVRYTELGEYRGVWFDTADIQEYLTVKMKRIIDRHTRHQLANGININNEGYQWKLAFYWLVRKEVDDTPIRPGIGYYVVPVLVKQEKDTTIVLDYFKSYNNSYYAHPPSIPTAQHKNFTDSFNVHDEGHLWP